jgi:hypothetical protein
VPSEAVIRAHGSDVQEDASDPIIDESDATHHGAFQKVW